MNPISLRQTKLMSLSDMTHSLGILPSILAVCIFLTINWSIVSHYFVIDGAMRFPFCLGLVCVALAGKFCFSNLFVLSWFCWCGYALVNVMISAHGINRIAYPHFFNLIAVIYLPWMMLAVSTTYTYLKPHRMFLLMLVSTSVCCIDMLYRSEMLINFSLAERMKWGEEATTVNANEFGIVLAFFLNLGIMFFYQRGKKNLPLLLLFAGIVFLLIFRTASRTAFLIAVLGIGTMLFLYEKKHFLKLLSCLVILYFIFTAAAPHLENTALFTRFQNTTEEQKSRAFGDTLVGKYMGDRAVYYFYGSEIFMRYPVHGVGFHNYIFYNPIGALVCHVEVMSQLAEEGLLGFFLFLIFYGSIGVSIYKNRAYSSTNEWKFALVLFLMVCAANFASFTSYKQFYYMILGYVVANQCLLEEKRRRNENIS